MKTVSKLSRLPRPVPSHGFTVLELLAAVTIMAFLVLLLFSAFNQGRRGWSSADKRAQAFQEARRAVLAIGNDLSTAFVGGTIKFVGYSNKVYFVAPVSASEGWTPSTNNSHVVTNDLVDLAWVGYEFIPDATAGGYIQRKYAPPLVRYSGSNAPASLNSWSSHVFGSSETGGDTNFLQFITTNGVVSCRFDYVDSLGALQSEWSASKTNLPLAVRIRVETVDIDTVKKVKAGGDASVLIPAATRVVETQVYLQNSR